jgi:hypothetical protein
MRLVFNECVGRAYVLGPRSLRESDQLCRCRDRTQRFSQGLTNEPAEPTVAHGSRIGGHQQEDGHAMQGRPRDCSDPHTKPRTCAGTERASGFAGRTEETQRRAGGIAGLLRRQVEAQDPDLVMKLVQLSEARLADSERALRSAKSEERVAKGERDELEMQRQVLAAAVERDRGEAQLVQAEAMAPERGRQLEMTR